MERSLLYIAIITVVTITVTITVVVTISIAISVVVVVVVVVRRQTLTVRALEPYGSSSLLIGLMIRVLRPPQPRAS